MRNVGLCGSLVVMQSPSLPGSRGSALSVCVCVCGGARWVLIYRYYGKVCIELFIVFNIDIWSIYQYFWQRWLLYIELLYILNGIKCTAAGCLVSRRVCLTLSRLLFQEEGSGFLPACLSVGLLLSVCLQTHASVHVQPVGWEVRRAGSQPLPVLRRGAALHHSHQAQHLQEQLELWWYRPRASLVADGSVVKCIKLR